MTTEDNFKRFITLLIAAVTFCLIGSFVVSFNLVDFLYLVMMYGCIFYCSKASKNNKKE